MALVASRLAARGETPASHRDGRGASPARRDDREYREYLREEQRSRRGCIARRMQPAFHHGLLAAVVLLARAVRRLRSASLDVPAGGGTTLHLAGQLGDREIRGHLGQADATADSNGVFGVFFYPEHLDA